MPKVILLLGILFMWSFYMIALNNRTRYEFPIFSISLISIFHFVTQVIKIKAFILFFFLWVSSMIINIKEGMKEKQRNSNSPSDLINAYFYQELFHPLLHFLLLLQPFWTIFCVWTSFLFFKRINTMKIWVVICENCRMKT